MTKLTDRLIAVEVPEDVYDYFIGYFSGGFCYRGGENKPQQNIVGLPPGQWRIVGTVTDGVPDWFCFSVEKMEWEKILTSHSCHTGKWVIIEKVNS